MSVKNIIIDTDLGNDIDDALALTLAMKNKSSKIVGIISAGGLINCRTTKIQQLLDSLDAKTPVFKGREKTLSGKKQFFTGTECKNIPHSIYIKNFQSHLRLWEKIIEKKIKVKVVCIGPLTNIATAITKTPRVKKVISEIIIMGGIFNNEVFANYTSKGEFSEHNLAADPVATNIVFKSGIDITVVPLNLTLQTSLKRKQLNQVLFEKTNLHDLISVWTREWLNFTKKLPPSCVFKNQVFLHDPLTIALAMNLITFKARRIPILINKNGLMRKQIKNGKIVKVCVEADIKKLKEIVCNSLV